MKHIIPLLSASLLSWYMWRHDAPFCGSYEPMFDTCHRLCRVATVEFSLLTVALCGASTGHPERLPRWRLGKEGVEYRPLLKVALPDTQRENVVKLKKFIKFENTAEALGAAACLVDSKLDKSTAYCRIKKLKTGLDRKKGKHWTVCLHSYSCALHVKLPRPSLHAYISLCLVNKALPKVQRGARMHTLACATVILDT
eukprot:524463-Prorocentrum_minimum.AAC.2